MGLTSVFLARDDLPRAHWGETVFSSTKYCNAWSLSNIFNIVAFGFSYLIITYTLGCIYTPKYISYYILMFFERASYNVFQENNNNLAPCIYIQMWRWASDISWSHLKWKYPVINEPKCFFVFFFRDASTVALSCCTKSPMTLSQSQPPIISHQTVGSPDKSTLWHTENTHTQKLR